MSLVDPMNPSPEYPGTSPFAGIPGTTGGSEILATADETALPNPVPPLSSNGGMVDIAAGLWGSMREMANDSFDYIKRNAISVMGQDVEPLPSTYESQEEYDQWATKVEAERERMAALQNSTNTTELGTAMFDMTYNNISDTISSWTKSGADAVTQLIDQTRQRWVEHETQKFYEGVQELSENTQRWLQTVKDYTAPVRFNRAFEDFFTEYSKEEANRMAEQITAETGVEAPIYDPRLHDHFFTVTEQMTEAGFSAQDYEDLDRHMSIIWEEWGLEKSGHIEGEGFSYWYSILGGTHETANQRRARSGASQRHPWIPEKTADDYPFSLPPRNEEGQYYYPEGYFQEDQTYPWTIEEQVSRERLESEGKRVPHLLKEALHRLGIERQQGYTRMGADKRNTALNKIIGWLDYQKPQPSPLDLQTETNIPGSLMLRDTPDMTDKRTLLTAMEDIISGDAHRASLRAANVFDTEAYNFRNVGDHVIGLALGKVITGYSGGDPEEYVSSKVKKAGEELKEYMYRILPAVEVEDIIEGLSYASLPGIMRWLSEQIPKESDYTISREFMEAKLGNIEALIHAETKQLQLHRAALQHQQARIDNLDRAMANPEYQRLQFLARRFKEEGYEDPTGNNWESTIDENGNIVHTWEEATYQLVEQVYNGEHIFSANNILRLYNTSFKVGENWAKKHGTTDDGKWSSSEKTIQNMLSVGGQGGRASASDQFRWAVLSRHKGFIGLDPMNPAREELTPELQNRMLQEYRAMVEMWDALWQQEGMHAETIEGMAEKGMTSRIPFPISEAQMMAGQWGVDVSELDTSQLFTFARFTQNLNRMRPTVETPAIVKEIGVELQRRMGDWATGRGTGSTADKGRAMAAASTLANLYLGSSHAGNINLADYLSDVPDHIAKLMTSWAQVSLRNQNRFDLSGQSMEEIIYRFNSGDFSEPMLITDNGTDPPSVIEVVDEQSAMEAINMMYEPWNKQLDTLGLAMTTAMNQSDPAFERMFTADFTTANNFVNNVLRNNELNLNRGENEAKAFDLTLNEMGVRRATYEGGKQVDLTPVGVGEKPVEVEGTDASRLQHLITTFKPLYDSLEGEGETMDAAEAESRIFQLLASNPQTAMLMSSVLATHNRIRPHGEVDTISILEDTFTLMGTSNLYMIKTGEGKDDIAMMNMPKGTKGTPFSHVPNAYDVNTGVEGKDDRTKMRTLYNQTYAFTPARGRDEHTWNVDVVQNWMPQVTTMVTDVVGPMLGVDDDEIKVVIGQIMEEERKRYLGTNPVNMDIFWYEQSFPSGRGLQRLATGKLYQGWENMTREEQTAILEGQSFRGIAYQDVLLGTIHRLMDKNPALANQYTNLYDTLEGYVTPTQTDAQGNEYPFRYSHVMFDLAPDAMAQDIASGIRDPHIRVRMDTRDIGGRAGTVGSRLVTHQTDLAGLVNLHESTYTRHQATGEHLEKARNKFILAWNSLWTWSDPVKEDWPEELRKRWEAIEGQKKTIQEMEDSPERDELLAEANEIYEAAMSFRMGAEYEMTRNGSTLYQEYRFWMNQGISPMAHRDAAEREIEEATPDMDELRRRGKEGGHGPAALGQR